MLMLPSSSVYKFLGVGMPGAFATAAMVSWRAEVDMDFETGLAGGL